MISRERALAAAPPAELVDLREHDDGRHLELREKVEHSHIVVSRVAPNVQKLDHARRVGVRRRYPSISGRQSAFRSLEMRA